MRLAFYLALIILVLGSFKYGYFSGYNTGSKDERLFMSNVIAPLCANIVTMSGAEDKDHADQIVLCIQGVVKDAN